MEILKHEKNELLNREELILSLESEATPSKQEIIKKISEKFKKPEENIVVEHIKGKFGLKQFEISAKIYETIKDKKKYETITKKQRDELKKQAEEAKKAESSEVKKSEETAQPEKPSEEIGLQE